MEIPRELLVQMLRSLIMSRRFDEKIMDEYKKGAMPGFWVHPGTGQEAIPVGTCAALRKDDFSTGSVRWSGWFLSRGADPKLLLADMLGRKGSYSGGKGGPIHLSCLDKNIIGIVGLVPAWLPIMTGTALSAKLRKTGQVAVCPFGDGASNQGYFHEGLNFASVHKLPIVFVCENNLYAISVSVKQSTSVENIADRAVGYNMPGVVVDGNDVIAVYEAVLQAVNRARQGDGPTLIECKTYRWGGHFAMDPGTKYRPKEEIESWMKKCPLKRFRKKLLEDNITTESEIKQIESDVENQLEEAITYANECPYPEPQELLTGVFADQDKKDERRRQ